MSHEVMPRTEVLRFNSIVEVLFTPKHDNQLCYGLKGVWTPGMHCPDCVSILLPSQGTALLKVFVSATSAESSDRRCTIEHETVTTYDSVIRLSNIWRTRDLLSYHVASAIICLACCSLERRYERLLIRM